MKDFADVVAFHGHSCGGLAIGYKACELAIQELGLTFSADEEIVAVTETDSCTVDAIQVVLGCTAGKGNLFVNNWGKTAFSFYRRDNASSIRLVINQSAMPANPEMVALRPKIMSGAATPEEEAEFHRLAHVYVDQILAIPAEDMFIVKKADVPLPKPAMLYNNVTCSCCGETVADGLAVQKDGQYICIPCSRK